MKNRAVDFQLRHSSRYCLKALRRIEFQRPDWRQGRFLIRSGLPGERLNFPLNIR